MKTNYFYNLIIDVFFMMGNQLNLKNGYKT